MSASCGLEHFGEEISFGPKINAASVGCIVSVEDGEPVVVHSGWHKVAGTTGHYGVDDGICVELLPEPWNEIIIYQVLTGSMN